MRKIIILLLFSALSISVQSQKAERGTPFSQFSLNMGASISMAPGLRLEGATPISDRFKLRVGFTGIPKLSGKPYSERLKIEDPKIKDYITEKNMDPAIMFSSEIASFSSQLLIDFTPYRNGLFHVTAGFFFGGAKLDIQGDLVNLETGGNFITEIREAGYHDEIPIIEHEDLHIQFNDNASMSANIFMGDFIKPYIGFGLGRSIPNNRIGLKAEFGLLRIGGLTLSSQNLMDINNEQFDKENLSNALGKDNKKFQFYERYAAWSPLFNLMLTIRLI